MKFEKKKAPGCLHGYKFVYIIDTGWSPAIVESIANKSRGEITHIQRTKFFRCDIPGVGCLTGIYGEKAANLIINPTGILQEKEEKFETLLKELID